MRQELRNDDEGCYTVTTATGSQYVFDLTVRTVRRQMAASAPIVDYLEAGFSRLRRDGETLELLTLASCVIGAPAQYCVQVRNDHIPTLRRTSPVLRIEAMGAPAR